MNSSATENQKAGVRDQIVSIGALAPYPVCDHPLPKAERGATVERDDGTTSKPVGGGRCDEGARQGHRAKGEGRRADGKWPIANGRPQQDHGTTNDGTTRGNTKNQDPNPKQAPNLKLQGRWAVGGTQAQDQGTTRLRDDGKTAPTEMQEAGVRDQVVSIGALAPHPVCDHPLPKAERGTTVEITNKVPRFENEQEFLDQLRAYLRTAKDSSSPAVTRIVREWERIINYRVLVTLQVRERRAEARARREAQMRKCVELTPN